MPTDLLAASVDRVEKGEAPEVYDAATVEESGETITRQLCKWLSKPVYMGVSDSKRASRLACSDDTTELKTAYASGAHGKEHDEL